VLRKPQNSRFHPSFNRLSAFPCVHIPLAYVLSVGRTGHLAQAFDRFHNSVASATHKREVCRKVIARMTHRQVDSNESPAPSAFFFLRQTA
jgi:hypothetical protein